MSIQPVNNPPIKIYTKPIILSKIQWLGRQISTFRKTLYSQLTKITYLFYQTIKTHPKKTLAIFAGITVTLFTYYKGKMLVTFLKSLNKESKEKTLQRTIKTLSEQFSKESKKLEQQLLVLEKSVQDIHIAQKIINDSINNKQLQIITQYKEIKEDFKKLIECKSHVSALPEEKITLLKTNIKSLPALNQRIAQLITETNKYKTHLSHVSNPFEP
ncbi:hypothetical protein [Candidatus Rhabdochlamydia porcellionis]|jgi:hypothetical protein|uniref:Uncharacterized protein n=1 Tax=Candidatus Rhabdochlamydia porcellionis TaxID=225148 RepID=A0ABX8Z1A2_9BACT|nr:hypothetical protein [Candidatus Rhabdochlamydia porcellionis]QZA59135.1 hypothetical protein RHAB15C_0001020 [Candidatus Rhabdochlamydia porcellionis]